MIRHLLKMIWNRKRANALMILEIFGSFIVLFGVCLFSLHYYTNFNAPMGFEINNVWSVNLGYPQDFNTGNPEIDINNNLQELQKAVQELPQVLAAACVAGGPYSMARMSLRVTTSDGQDIEFGFCSVSEPFNRVMNLKLTQGKWMQDDQASQSCTPVIINQKLADSKFGLESPLGKFLDDDREFRVSGVVKSLRIRGELSSESNFALLLNDLHDQKNSTQPDSLLLKMRPGTTAEFEQTLMNRLQQVAPDFSFQIDTLEKIRHDSLQIGVAPLLIAGLIAGFLLIMVGFGITGVLWQNVISRTKEFGLRRAQGASQTLIFKQVLGELSVITTFGLLLGAILVIQLPLLNLISFISMKVYFSSVLLAAMIIYAITLLSGIYPSWFATRLQPAEALHHE